MSSIEEEAKHMQIPLQELSDSTNGFSEQNLIARGGFGKVYKGVSVKHGIIAVKVLDPRRGAIGTQFRTEIDLLSAYKHKNIACLLGFCDEDGQKILVYKHENNGSLDKHLDRKDLTWIQRLQICLDAALGLQYLHDYTGSRHRILHRDIKSSNILLDENLKAKISDFGLSRVGPANMQSTFLISGACGTLGYIDPEYLNTGFLTQKSDVYSFGVVLFEVLCGRLTRVREYTDERHNLIVWVKIHYKRNTLLKIIHPDLRKQINMASLVTFSTIAYQCLLSGNERPRMKMVVKQLQKALANQVAQSPRYDGDFAAHFLGQSRLVQTSSSQSRPASSSQSWKYDVFISFREEDAHKTFVDHLYAALLHKGIFAYEDKERLPQGETISSSLIKTIEESRIAIIVFSQNYASSSSCLDELSFIMKNREEKGQIIIPIFYDVDLSEAKKQKRYYEEALALHESSNSNKVEIWRQALVEAANLAGWEARVWADGNETKLINTICDDISLELLSLMQRCEASAEVNADTFLHGLPTRMQELKSLLRVGSGGVHMVGVCGMWGSGKSTLASSIYDEISHEFEGCCFIKNVRAKSRVYGLKTLQEKILKTILNSDLMLRSINQGIYMMERRLRKKSVLIVLDDVDHIDHLKTLAGSKNWFGNGSRIIFTTRNQDLVNAHNAITHNVKMLDDIEATKLFNAHAFGNSKSVQAGFKNVSLKMVSKFGGNPLAVKTLGSFLHGKDMSEWIYISDRLEGIPNNYILKNFKVHDDGVVKDISGQLITYLKGLEPCRRGCNACGIKFFRCL